MDRARALVFASVLLAACASSGRPPPAAAIGQEEPGVPAAERDAEQAGTDPAHTEDAAALSAIRSIHGGTGPWVVAGYRMGRYALAKLGLSRGSFDLQVVHHAPREVQYTCIADGAAAATGASLGRLNLSLQQAEPQATRTTYSNRATGASLTLQTTESFALRFMNVPRSQLSAAGAAVLHLADAEIFREVPSAQ